MPDIISNTSCLIILDNIDRLEILQKLVGWADDCMDAGGRAMHGAIAKERSPSIATDAPPSSAHPTKTTKHFKPFEEWKIPR